MNREREVTEYSRDRIRAVGWDRGREAGQRSGGLRVPLGVSGGGVGLEFGALGSVSQDGAHEPTRNVLRIPRSPAPEIKPCLTFLVNTV